MNLSPIPVQKFFDNNGRPLVDGLLFTYAAGTSTKIATYSDEAGTPNTNPIVLDYRGECRIWLDPELTYKFVLSPEGDTDPPTKPIWTVDDISGPLTFIDITAQFIGELLWPRTPEEISEGIVPVNYAHPPGSFIRYGMDPTGLTDSAAEFENACSCNNYVFDDFPGGGTYLFTRQADVSRYPLRVEGSSLGPIGSIDAGGTTFKLSSAAAIGAACVSITGFSDLEFCRVKFQLRESGGTRSFIGLQFAELRNSVVEKCSFFGPGTTSDDTQGIELLGTGTFTGGVVVDQCYFSNNQFGVNVQGSVTDLHIISCTFYGTPLHASSIGINFGDADNNGCMVIGNSFDQLNRGVYSIGSGIKQVGNRFEGPTAPWEWVVGQATRHQSVGDTYIGGGVPVYAQTDAAGHQVYGAEAFIAGQNFINTRSYIEGDSTNARAYAMGYPQSVTFAGGNYTGNGSMTLTAVTQNWLVYSIVGKTLTVWFSFTGTVGGTPNTTLQIAMPGGFMGGAAGSDGSCDIVNAGTTVKSTCNVAAAGTVIRIFTTPAGSGNWTAGAVAASGQLQINVA